LHYSLPATLAVGYRVLADAQPRSVDVDFEQAAKQIKQTHAEARRARRKK